MDSKESCSSGLFGKPASVVGDDEPIGSAGAGVVSMESLLHDYQQQQQQQQQQQHNNKGPMSPPPVAMSLRARETSAMDLKRIYDQQIINGREQEFKSIQRQHVGGFQGMRNQSMPDLRKRIPDLDITSFRKAQDNILPYAQAGFGSPISTPTHQSSLPQASLPPMNGQLMQHNYLPQATASTRLNPSSRQPTAQMTIFYSGNVNVYDDVPADKAHAIMLLAGNSWSSNFRSPAPPSVAPVVPAEMMMVRETPPSPAKATPSQHTPAASTNNSIGKSFASPAPAASVAAATLASPPPSPALQAPAPLVDAIKSPQAGAAAKRPNAGIELPHARKASLARFLEKRKDRVQVQQQDQQGGAAAEKGAGEPTSCNDKPEHAAEFSSSKKQCSMSNVNDTSNNARDGSPMINEHCFFH